MRTRLEVVAVVMGAVAPALALSGCLVASARVEFERQAEEGLAEFYLDELSQRWDRVDDRPRFDRLRLDDTVSVELGRFEPDDSVAVVGSCDDDCVDLKIDIVSGPVLIGSHIDLESFPFAAWLPQAGRAYRADVSVRDCKLERCFFALLVLKRRIGDRRADGDLSGGPPDEAFDVLGAEELRRVEAAARGGRTRESEGPRASSGGPG